MRQPQISKSMIPYPKRKGVSLIDYLHQHCVPFTVIHHTSCEGLETAAALSQIPYHKVLRTVLLQDKRGPLMAILPADHLLDFQALCQYLDRELSVVSKEEARGKFYGSEPGTTPALPVFFGIEGILDEAIQGLDEVYIEPGVHHQWLKISSRDFLQLHGDLWRGKFSCPRDQLGQRSLPEFKNVIHHFLPQRLKERTQDTIDLPAMPPMADAILRLRVDPGAQSKDLAAIIEKDPSLSAQLISWAQSPFYGYAGKVTSVECAIVKVLGFDLVMNLALAIAIGKSIKAPLEGPLGLKAFWLFSVFCGVLVEQLVHSMPVDKRPFRGLAYLSGLLHNFGHLVLAQVFPPQYFLLNRYIEANPDISWCEIEHYVLGVGHEQIGAWLMNAWHMPEELIFCVRRHHQEEYASAHGVYSNLVLVATRLLKQKGLGDATHSDLPPGVLDMLGLTETQCQETLAQLFEQEDEITALVNQIAE